MSNPPKSEKHQKFAVNCAFGEKCSRRNCSFKHPDGWDAAANQRKIQQKRREAQVLLQQQQRVTVIYQCRHGDLCRRVDCHLQHSPDWDPKRNQQLFEEKRRRDEQRREEQRKYAYDVSTKEMIEEKNDVRNCQSQKKSPQKHLIGDEYEYDDEYFDVQEKIWKKQSAHHLY
jgi:hypothetical protein